MVTVYPHKWSPISYRSSAGQRKHAGQRPMFNCWTTQPTKEREEDGGEVLRPAEINEKWATVYKSQPTTCKLDGSTEKPDPLSATKVPNILQGSAASC